MFEAIAMLAVLTVCMILLALAAAPVAAGGGVARPVPSPWPTLDDVLDWIAALATVLTNAGRAIITNRLRSGGTEPLYIGWGTGAGTAAATDTTLFTEKDVDLATGTGTRTTGTSSQQTGSVTSDTYQVTGTRTMSAAGPVAVTNAGLWDNSTIGSGNLFMKGDFSSINLSLNDSIAFTFQLKFT